MNNKFNVVIDDFQKTFSIEIFNAVMAHVGQHSESTGALAVGATLDEDTEQRLYFGLLELIDYQCWDYDHAPKGLTEAEVKSFLKKYHNRITCEPPSMIGVMCGVFNFLTENVQ